MLHTDVAIVGGGPGGMAACAAVLKKCPELKVRVFERETALRRVGNFVGMDPNGRRALKALQPKVWEKVQEDIVTFDEVVKKDYGRDDIIINLPEANTLLAWYNLRHRLSEVLPKQCLKLGYTLQDMVQSDEGVNLKFSSPEQSYNAKVVIGCDGYQSQVRKICLQDGPPAFKNYICWRGVIEWPKYWPYMKNQLFSYGGKNNLKIFVAGVDEEYLGWQSILPFERQNGDSLSLSRSVQIAPSGEDCKKRCLDAFERQNFPDFLENAIKDTPPDSLTEHGIFARHPDSCGVWGKGSITLLGDAAHATSPALGQGTSQALIDAVELGRSIGELGACDKALRQYEEVRIDAVKPIQQGSWDVTDGLLSEVDWHEQNPWCRSQTIEPL